MFVVENKTGCRIVVVRKAGGLVVRVRFPAARLNEGEWGTEPQLGKSLAGLRFVTSLRFRQNGSAPARTCKTERSSNLFWTKNAWLTPLSVSASRTSASKAKQFSFNFLYLARDLFSFKRNWKLFCFDVLIPRRRKRFVSARAWRNSSPQPPPSATPSLGLPFFSAELEAVPISLARRPRYFFVSGFFIINKYLKPLK